MRVRRHPLLLIALAAACGGSQVDHPYPGAPLVQYGGYVIGRTPVPLFELRFVWQQALPPVMTALRPEQDGASSQAWTIDTTLYWFQTVVFQPPPADAFLRLAEGEVDFARGNTITVPLGIGAAGIAELPGSLNPAYGADLDYWVLYLKDDVPAGSLTEWWLHGNALAAGYHLVRVDVPHCLTAAEFDECAAEVVPRGLTDDGTYGPGTARAFCATFAPSRATPAATWEASHITLGTSDFPGLACALP